MQSSALATGWQLKRGRSPLVVTAIHAGHQLRPSLLCCLALNEEQRLREEDPQTSRWLHLSDTWVRVDRSRFEVDLNRPSDRCVYLEPNDAWGLEVWNMAPPANEIETSKSLHAAFYADLNALLSAQCESHGGFVLYDLHSYNHRRQGPNAPPAPWELNPEVNVGTGSLDRSRWERVVEAFMDQLKSYDFMGRTLDVRENVKFQGGHFPRWVHDHFGHVGCVLSLEIKKFFVNEWSGETDEKMLLELNRALGSTTGSVLRAASLPNRSRTSRALAAQIDRGATENRRSPTRLAGEPQRP